MGTNTKGYTIGYIGYTWEDRAVTNVDSMRRRPQSVNEARTPAPKPCGFCEASPGDNDHCVWDGTPHYWHRCSGIVASDSNCPNVNGSER